MADSSGRVRQLTSWLRVPVGLLVAFLAGVTAITVFQTTLGYYDYSGYGLANDIVLSGDVESSYGLGQYEGEEFTLVIDGDVRVNEEGGIFGSVYALDGDIDVNGQVTGDVVAPNGTVTVEREGLVEGDVVSAGGGNVEGRVEGTITRFYPFVVFRSAAWLMLHLMVPVALGGALALGALLVTFLPRVADAARTASQRLNGKPIVLAWGTLLVVALPLISLAVIPRMPGPPVFFVTGLLVAGFALALGFATGLYCLGCGIFTASTWRISSLLLGAVAFFVPLIGLAILSRSAAQGAIALGAIAYWGLTVFGLGSLAVAGFRAVREAKPRSRSLLDVTAT